MPQVDRSEGLVGNTGIKAPVLVATTTNITLNGEQTVDGVSVVTGDRVLVKDQTDATENGIWVVDTGDWDRSKDFNGKYDASMGTLVMVVEGSASGNTLFKVTTEDPFTIGSDDIDFGPAGLADSSSLMFTQSGTGAVPRTLQSKERDWFSVKDFGVVGDGATNDRAAFILAQAAAGSNPLLIPQGTVMRVNSDLTVTANLRVDGMFKPAAGVTITLNGAYEAGMWQTIDLSLGGHVDFTAAAIPRSYIEWYGVVGTAQGVVFNATTAAANKPLIDEAIRRPPRRIGFFNPPYDTTGHVLPGTYNLVLEGVGATSDSVRIGVRGSGIPFVYANEMPTTDPAHWMSYIFQNGLQDVGNRVTFENLSVIASDTTTTTVVPIGKLTATSVALNPNMNWTGNCLFEGYFGVHVTLDYASSFGPGCVYIGNGLTVNANNASFSRCAGGAAIAMTVPSLVYSGGVNETAVVRSKFYSPELGMTGAAAGQFLYQFQYLAAGGAAINSNSWYGPIFAGPAYDGFVLDAGQQEFYSAELEQITHNVFGSAELGSSLWVNPYASTNFAALTLSLNYASGSRLIFRGADYGFLLSASNALTATGTNRATAYVITNSMNNFGTVAAGTGAVLPVAVPGASFEIFNNGANAMQIYANGTDTIDGIPPATGVPLTNTKRCLYKCFAGGGWISAQLGVVSA